MLKYLIQIIILLAILAIAIIALKQKFAPYFISKSISAFDKGDLNESLIYSNIAVRLDPLEPQVHYILGEIYNRRQIYGIAIKEHKRAVELNPMLYKSHYSLGQIYLKINRYKDAFEVSKEALKIQPPQCARFFLEFW